ncbi:hypothetical protein OG828_47135 [Streptomyces sp. NBC_00457]|uniref:SbtR family transcriptional regulator n=1 Tax=Streptomyces sp. NBC_00457 TaxID=2975748 RepID=UPI002E23B255
MEQLVIQARTALTEEPDPWSAFARFLRDVLSAQGAGGPLLPLVGGRLPATDDSAGAADRLRGTLDDLVGGAHRAGVLWTDFTSADIPLLLEHLSARMPVAGERAAALHLRFLDLVLAGLRTSAPDRPTALPGPAPHWRNSENDIQGKVSSPSP